MISVRTVDELISGAFPAYEDSFDEVFRVQQLAFVFEQLKKSYGVKRTGMMGKILTLEQTSPYFRVVHGSERVVNLQLLQKDRLDVYEQLVYLRASDAKEVLGERLLYDLCLETDEKFTLRNGHVRSENLVAFLGESEAARYLSESLSPAKARLVRVLVS